MRRAREHALRRRYGHADVGDWKVFDMMGAPAFRDELLKRLEIGDRQAHVRAGVSWGPGKEGDVYINFINLPRGIGGAGGGAEAENNRASFWIRGFGREDAPSPSGKLKIEMANSALPRTYKLRAKTAAPGVIAKYIADFLVKIAREVPPKFTHTGQEYYEKIKREGAL